MGNVNPLEMAQAAENDWKAKDCDRFSIESELPDLTITARSASSHVWRGMCVCCHTREITWDDDDDSSNFFNSTNPSAQLF